MIIRYITFLLLIFTLSCGYKAVNNLESFNFAISKYELSGDKKINYILDRNFKRFQSNKNNEINYKILAESKKNISALSKDIAGKILSYNIEIIIKLEIFRDQKLVDDISFKKNTNYDNLSSKFELKQYENILLKDLVEEITIDINNHISSLR
tara:strand:- start:638 stop:1096 length:459 start_codon:yes stop_codon:yes gene_type:complete